MDCCQPQNNGYSCNTGCCGSKEYNQSEESNVITIDFLYLDINVCNRCQGTYQGLDEAIEDVTKVLELTGRAIVINKTHTDCKEKGIQHRLLTSPTILELSF